MSRAFTKEIDDAPEAALPDRPISAARNLVTPLGAELIRNMVSTLSHQVEAAKTEEARAAIRRDLRYWSQREASMEIVTPPATPSEVTFGPAVTLRRGGKMQTVSIVGEDEAEPTSGQLAWTSPLAEALLGAVPGEDVEFERGGRTEMLTVIAVASPHEHDGAAELATPAPRQP